MNNQSWEPETGEEILENLKKEIQRIKDSLMNYNEIGKYKRPMNIFEKLLTGWK